ncbi:MAG: hypothetical protein Wins2KO_17770 [Winogradskyella sp.]
MKSRIFTAFLILSVQLSFSQFITTWETTGNNQSIIIPTNSDYTYNYDVDWGDGTTSTNQTANAQHFYAVSGIYTVTITGDFPAIFFNKVGPFNSVLATNRNRIKTIEQWGSNIWVSMNNAFSGCTFLTINAVDNPDLSQVTDMNLMFFDAANLTGDLSGWDVSNVTTMVALFSETNSFNGDLSSWDVSNVTNMTSLFSSANGFNSDISNWDVSSVTDMTRMFYQAGSFNQNIGNWDVSNVTSMNGMFRRAFVFDQAIGNWNVSNVTDMSEMFEQAFVFNQNIGSWDVSNVDNMNSMFLSASAFNQPLDNWDVSNVTDMADMFHETPFNQPLGNWNVSQVTDMSSMFRSALAFNQNIGSWDVSSVVDMSFMFFNAELFNQNISSWDVSNVADMSFLFSDAIAFNQNLGNWNISSVTDMFGMLSETSLSVTNYDATLIGWANQMVLPNVSLSADGLSYCSSVSARNVLTSAPNNWSIYDDVLDCSSLPAISILDPNFEQALIDLGIDSDGIINGELLATDALGVTDLNISSYNISDLTGIEFFTDLEVLTAFNNNLSSVDLSQNTGLTTILLALNNLTEIDLSSHPNLISLSLNDNSISTIDLSNNLQLQQVFLNNNLLSEVDVDILSNLANLGVSGNTIVELDLSNNTLLQTLFCQDNNLVNLNVQNGNNTNVTNFEAANNSNLTCIQVDDISYSTANWTLIDSQSFFGLDCAPSNDGCNEATPIDLGIVVTGTTQSATSSGLSPSCQQNGIILIDVWYEFEAPLSGSITVVANSVLSSIKVAIYDDCANGTPIACDSAGIVVNNLNPGQTYYAQVWVEASVGGRSQDTLVGDFDIQVADSSTLSVGENLVQDAQLFPNPASSQVTIKTHSGIDTISIFDVAGKEVFQVSAINQNDYILNVQSLSKGIYLLQIHGQNAVMNKRLLIK